MKVDKNRKLLLRALRERGIDTDGYLSLWLEYRDLFLLDPDALH